MRIEVSTTRVSLFGVRYGIKISRPAIHESYRAAAQIARTCINDGPSVALEHYSTTHFYCPIRLGDLVRSPEKILNSKGESFDQVWERRKAAYPLSNTSDPRFWAIDPEEETFSREFSLMDIDELRNSFIDLISGNHPTIESSKYFLKEKDPLVAFLNNLSDCHMEIDHHFRSPSARISTIRSCFECLEKEEDRQKCLNYIAQARKYRAFMRELMTRWG